MRPSNRTDDRWSRRYALRTGLLCTALLFLTLPQGISAELTEDERGQNQRAPDDLFGEDELSDEEDLFDSADRRAEDSPQSDSTPDLGVSPDGESATEPQRGPSSGAEEILIQGSASEGVAADEPVAVTSFGADDIEAMGIANIGDLAAFVPSLEIRQTGGTTPTFFIRGVGLNDFTANAAGSVAIHQDDVAIALPAIQLGQLFDEETVDILKGPQNGPGAVASAGAIKIYSQKPSGDLNGKLNVSYGRFNALNVEGALEVPIIQDILSSRVSFLVSQRDEIVENRCGGAPPLDERITDRTVRDQDPLSFCGETNINRMTNPAPRPPGEPAAFRFSGLKAGLPDELNSIDRWAGRAIFRIQPPELDLSILVNIHGSSLNEPARVGQALGTGGVIDGVEGILGGSTNGYTQPEIERERADILSKQTGPDRLSKARRILARRLAQHLDRKPFEGDYNKGRDERLLTAGGSIRVDGFLGDAAFSLIAGGEWYDRERDLDSDFTPNVVFENDTEDEAWQASAEFRLDGEFDEHPLRWHTGINYLTTHIDYQNLADSRPGIFNTQQFYEQDAHTLGLHAGFEWDFIDDFTLQGNLRYNYENKKFKSKIIVAATLPCEVVNCEDDSTWSVPTGDLSLVYHFTDEVQVYLKYSRGWKGGQYNIGNGARATGVFTDGFQLADPETLDAFEWGLKAEWFDGRLSLQASIFNYDYNDYQVFLTRNDFQAPPERIVVNASDAEIYGAEADVRVEPFDGLVGTLRAGWLESRFNEFTTEEIRQVRQAGSNETETTQVDIDFTGNRLPNTPRFKLSGSLEYTFEAGRYGSIVPRWDFSWTDNVFFDPSGGRGTPNRDGIIFLPKYTIGQKAYWLHHARLAYRTPDGRIEVAGWVRNITDQVYKTLAFDASASAQLIGNFVGDPRTYGASISFSW